MTKLKMIDLVKEKACSCTKCPELVKSRTQVVFGHGNTNSNLVLLGESSGRNEDKQGIPFCGESGRLLNNIIKKCGWKREDIYITNTILCHPDNNRNPSEEEMNNCRPFLDLQLIPK